MKKQILIVTLACALAGGFASSSFAQSNPSGAAGAGSVSGSKSDTSGANPSNNGTSAGPTAEKPGMSRSGGMSGHAGMSGGSGMGGSAGAK